MKLLRWPTDGSVGGFLMLDPPLPSPPLLSLLVAGGAL